jgi:hypothetical protein
VFSLPRSPRVRRIVFAYTLNRFGTWFGYVALSIAVFDHTHSALAVASLLVAGQVLSAFLVPVLVTWIEAHSSRGGLSALYLFEAVCTLLLAFSLLSRFSLPIILVLVAMDGTAALAASALLRTAAARGSREWAYAAHADAPSPAGQAPPDAHGDLDEDEDTEDDSLQAGALEAERVTNAALNFGFAITFTLGPALGGLVVPAFGAPAALFLDAASFLACGVLLADLVPQVEDGVSSVRARIASAWQHIVGSRTLSRLLAAESVALTFFTFSGPVEVEYAKVSLNAGPRGYGLLMGVWGLGVTIGSVVFARSVKRSLTTLLSLGTVAVGLAYVTWAVAPSLAVACGAALVGGIGNGVQWASFIGAVQQVTPQPLHGSLMGAVESLGAICPAVGYALAGAITVLGSPRDAFVIAGVGACLSTIAFARLPRTGLSRLTEAPADRW